MRTAILLVAALSGAGSTWGLPSELKHETGELYPRSPLPQLILGYLTDGGCSPLYVAEPPEGCVQFRGEAAWVELRLSWTGAEPIALVRTAATPVRGTVRRLPDGPVRVIDFSAFDAQGAAGDRLVLQPGKPLSLRVDLTVADAWAPGGYQICLTPTFAPPQGIEWQRWPTSCYQFALLDPLDTSARLEMLRRRSVDLLADLDCDAVKPLVSEMLDLDPFNAAAYRLRGAIAELERRPLDALADYGHVGTLLRSHGDTRINISADQRLVYAENLDDWRIGLENAGGLPLLNPDGLGPVCR